MVLLVALCAAAPARAEPAASPTPADAAAPKSPTRPLAEAVALDAGETCLEHDRLVRRIARWLERERVDARLRVRVKGGGSPDEVSFTIELEDADAGGRDEPPARRIEDAPADCGQLHSALALSIALAIDAALLDGEAVALDLPDDDDVFRAPSPPYFRLAAGVLGNASSGVLTDVAIGVSARVELGFVRWLDLRIGGAFTGVDDQRVGTTPGSFDARLLFARLDACAVADLIERLRLLGCAGTLVGGFETTGHGYSSTESEQKWWLAGALGLEVQIGLASWLATAVGAELVLPLARRTIEVAVGEDQRVGRSVTAAGVVVAAGPVFRFF